MQHAAVLLGWLALAGLAATALAQDPEGQGFAEVRGTSFSGGPGDRWQAVERVRPSFTTALGERTRVVGTVEAALTQGRGAPPAPRRAADYLDVDRLYLDLYGGELDLRAGRQALHWGSAQFFNPTDPFPEVLLTEPWRPRRGVNAVRAHAALGARADATMVGLLDDRLVHGRAAARLRVNVAPTDLAAVGAWEGGEDWLAGVDLRGTFGMGWWVEAALRGDGRATAQAAAGADYSFPVLESLLLTAQYQRDGAAGPGPGRAARDSLLAGASLRVTPDVGVSLFTLRSLHAPAGVAVPGATWGVTDRLDLNASATFEFGPVNRTAMTLWSRVSF